MSLLKVLFVFTVAFLLLAEARRPPAPHRRNHHEEEEKMVKEAEEDGERFGLPLVPPVVAPNLFNVDAKVGQLQYRLEQVYTLLVSRCSGPQGLPFPAVHPMPVTGPAGPVGGWPIHHPVPVGLGRLPVPALGGPQFFGHRKGSGDDDEDKTEDEDGAAGEQQH